MHKITSLALAGVFALAAPALAQEDTVTVDIAGITADLAADLGLDVDDLPTSVELSAEAAAEACGVDVAALGDTCVAVTTTDAISAAIEDDEEGAGPSENSAREFAPGQQDGPARDSAPGHQDGDAKDSAPGQQKKN
jgi:hypothetical protein